MCTMFFVVIVVFVQGVSRGSVLWKECARECVVERVCARCVCESIRVRVRVCCVCACDLCACAGGRRCTLSMHSSLSPSVLRACLCVYKRTLHHADPMCCRLLLSLLSKIP